MEEPILPLTDPFRIDEGMESLNSKLDQFPKFSNDFENLMMKKSESFSSTKEELSSHESEDTESCKLVSDEENTEEGMTLPTLDQMPPHRSFTFSHGNDTANFKTTISIPVYNSVGKWVQHTEYQISLTDSKRRCLINKRFSDFVKLDNRLKKIQREHKLICQLPELPPKKYWNRMQPNFIDHRKELLEEYLRQLINSSSEYSQELLNFLEADSLTQLIYRIVLWLPGDSGYEILCDILNVTETRKKSILSRFSHPFILEKILFMEMNMQENRFIICQILHSLLTLNGVTELLKANNYFEELLLWTIQAYNNRHVNSLDAIKSLCLTIVKRNPSVLESFLSLNNGFKLLKSLLGPNFKGEFDDFVSQLIWFALEFEEIQILLGDINDSDDNFLDLLLQSNHPVSLFMTGLSIILLVLSSKKKFENIRSSFHDYINSITKKMIQAQFYAHKDICDTFLTKLTLKRIRRFLTSNNRQANIITHFILWCCSYVLKVALNSISQVFINKYHFESFPKKLLPTRQTNIISQSDLSFAETISLSKSNSAFRMSDRSSNRYFWFSSLMNHINSDNVIISNLKKAFLRYGIYSASYHYLHSSFSNEIFFAYILLWIDNYPDNNFKPTAINKLRWINEFSSTNPSFLNASSKHEFEEADESEATGASGDDVFSEDKKDKPAPFSSYKPFLANPLDHLYKQQKVIKTLIPYVSKKLAEFKSMIDSKEAIIDSLYKRIAPIELTETEEQLVGRNSEQYPILKEKQLRVSQDHYHYVTKIQSYKSIYEELEFFEERLKNTLEAFGQKLNEANSNVAELNEKFKVIRNLEDELKMLIKNAKLQFQDLFSIRRYIKQLKEQLKGLKLQASQKRIKWTEINRKILELPEVIRSIEDELDTKKAAFYNIENQNETLNSTLETAVLDINERDKKLRQTISDISELDKLCSQLNQHINEQTYDFEGNINNNNEFHNEPKYQKMDEATFQRIFNENEITPLDFDVNSESFFNLLSLATYKRDRLSEDLNELSNLQEQKENLLKDLKFQKSFKAKELKKYDDEIQRLQKLLDEHANMQDLETQSENLREKALEYDTKINELNTEITSLEKLEKEKSPAFDTQKSEIYDKEKEISQKKTILGNLINEVNEYQPIHIRSIQKIEGSMRALVAMLDCLTSDVQFIQQNFNDLRQSLDSEQESKLALRYEILNFIDCLKNFVKRIDDNEQQASPILSYDAN